MIEEKGSLRLLPISSNEKVPHGFSFNYMGYFCSNIYHFSIFIKEFSKFIFVQNKGEHKLWKYHKTI